MRAPGQPAPGADDRFPDRNPNPVLRVDDEGCLVYANPASGGLLAGLGLGIGDRLPGELRRRLGDAAAVHGAIDVVADHRTFAIWPVPVDDLGVTNLYGTDVTAERAVVKFPDQNPNPVFRVDALGRLTYANAASAGLVDGLGLRVGDLLPDGLRLEILAAIRASEDHPIELEAGDRTYRLVPVDVPEFGFLNVYGTDITAERERERLARENERLLLNILPESIARRLREGEPLIADRFDDVTLLFADIVEFTRLSSSMSPSELVGVLNEVFTAFDRLVDRYGLEKIKTIGDAYMVVGGMSDPRPDHTARMARMALELAAAVRGIEAAARLGIAFRIGIHRGPVVAGVIGTRKFIYDVWGDTVNLASRMESTGVPGRVQVTYAVKERLGAAFMLESRGLVDVKGKGPTPTWFLNAAAATAEASTVEAAIAEVGLAPFAS